MGRDEGDPLVLQVKEAEHSVAEPFLQPSAFTNMGERVVQGQRLVQSASDIFLGWDTLRGIDGVNRDFYFRQLWDWKASADIETMEPATSRSTRRCAAGSSPSGTPGRATPSPSARTSAPGPASTRPCAASPPPTPTRTRRTTRRSNSAIATNKIHAISDV